MDSIIELPQDPPQELPEKSGWLKKKSTHLIKRWQNRYFVLRNKVLMYYYAESDPNPSTTINFDQVSISLEYFHYKSPKELILNIIGCKRSFRLKSLNNEDTLPSWAEILYLHINSSNGSKQDLKSVSIKPRFWKYARISNQRFISEANIGDILLFRSKALSAKLQRGVTQSKYDHVAMLLKWKDNQIGLLEATGKTGVQLLLWEDFMSYSWHLLYTRLVFRKLEIQRTEEMMEKLESFLAYVEGKKYSLSPTKIFKKRKTGEEENFFCSELIASAYKAIGAFPDDVSSSNFLPVHFSSKKSLPLVNCSLGQEFLIDFEL